MSAAVKFASKVPLPRRYKDYSSCSKCHMYGDIKTGIITGGLRLDDTSNGPAEATYKGCKQGRFEIKDASVVDSRCTYLATKQLDFTQETMGIEYEYEYIDFQEHT